ncbi:MAG TPA: pitrilysin family protein, partial [Thermoanaerobaculia bacterium]|nr:pitrilysin family protein [Thermoanaerobaculia bacterium]
LLAAALAAALAFAPQAAPAQPKGRPAASPLADLEVDIPYTRYVLKNGLTLIVHEDRKAPIVAVNVWYHVGSKNEPKGRSGFAHLFEHLMFNGSEHYDTDYFRGLEDIGATDVNGTTNEDRTNYFQNVPTPALDRVLFLESDRMGHLLGAIDQAKLDEQRGVVQNEKRQGENEPYAVAWELITKATFPAGHPYSWTVIGSMEDLDAASLEDVQEWFRGYYGPNNATIVVAGDVDAATARAKVEEYFGDIPPGPPVARWEHWPAKPTQERRARVEDRVPQSRLYMVWNAPGMTHPDVDSLDLLSDLLAAGKSSRLYKRLVYDERIATQVNAFVDSREIATLFTLIVTAAPGVELSRIEKAVDEEMAKLLAEGPSAAEVERAVNRQVAAFVRGAERIGGFGGKSDVLARCQVYEGDPGCWQRHLANFRAATPASLAAAGREWLSSGRYLLEVVPYPQLAAAGEGVDRSTVPLAGEPPAPEFPALQRATLSNGLELIVAERHAAPTVRASLVVDAGFAADQFGAPGTASFAMDVLDEGAGERDALAISDELARLGATLNTGSDLDASSLTMNALAANLAPSLALLADVALSPSFPENEITRLKAERLAAIQREKVSPIPIALRVMPRLLFGEGHAYATPWTGSGTEAAIQALGRDDLVRFHQTWFKPNNATLVLVGDTTLAEARPLVERLFGGWRQGDVPRKNLATVADRPEPEVYLIDRPGSIQSVILAGHVAPPRSSDAEPALQSANEVIGGGFVSRLNMNLREDKSWSYGAGSFVFDARGQRAWLAFAPVQSDQTGPSMAEVSKELTGLLNGSPVTEAELVRIKKDRVLSLPGSWETNAALANAIEEMVRYELPADYWSRYPGEVAALDRDDVQSAAGELIRPGHLVWLVVGDRAKVEEQIRAAGFEDIRYLDADGQPIGD